MLTFIALLSLTFLVLIIFQIIYLGRIISFFFIILQSKAGCPTMLDKIILLMFHLSINFEKEIVA